MSSVSMNHMYEYYKRSSRTCENPSNCDCTNVYISVKNREKIKNNTYIIRKMPGSGISQKFIYGHPRVITKYINQTTELDITEKELNRNKHVSSYLQYIPYSLRRYYIAKEDNLSDFLNSMRHYENFEIEKITWDDVDLDDLFINSL